MPARLDATALTMHENTCNARTLSSKTLTRQFLGGGLAALTLETWVLHLCFCSLGLGAWTQIPDFRFLIWDPGFEILCLDS